MPDNDLGTAHGQIRLDLDDRASAQTAAALAKIQAQMKALDDRFTKFEKTFNDYDKALSKNTQTLDKNTKATKTFDRSILDLHKNITTFSRDAVSLYKDLSKLSTVFATFKDIRKPFLLGANALDEYQRSLKSGEKAVTAFNKAWAVTGVTASVAGRQLGRNLVGINDSMKQMSRATQDIYKYAGAISAAGVATGTLVKFANSGGLNKFFGSFSNLGPIRKAIEENDRFASGLERMYRSIEKGPRGLDDFIRPLANFSNSTRGFLAGAALITDGVNHIADRFRWLAKIPKPIFYALGVTIADVLPAAFKELSKALVFTSNLFEGALDTAKQLSGGLLVIPGVFATIGAAASALFPVFSGLKKNFKDIFDTNDPTDMKFLTALYTMPQNLVPLAIALHNIALRFNDVQEALQNVAFKGVEDQINSLANTYMGRYQTGATQVILATRQMKDQFVAFAMATQTQKDFSEIYTNTAQAIIALSRAARPAADGVRDIAVAGNELIGNLSGGLPKLVQQFANWARVNRENGKLVDWMDHARHGVVDLIKASDQLGQGVWRLLTLFKTNTGAGFLDGLAGSMARFNDEIRKSATAGWLQQLSSAVKNIAGRDISGFKDMSRDIGAFLHGILPVINSVAQAFSGPFLGAMKLAFHELGLVGQAIHAIGLDSFVGTILGAAAGWSAFSNICVPLIPKLKIIAGTFLTLTNATKLQTGMETGILALQAGLQKLGPTGEKVADKMANVAGSISGIINKAAIAIPTLTGVALAATTVFTVISQGTEEVNAFNDAVKDVSKTTAEFGQSLNKAFMEDRGEVGHGVLTAITQGLDTLETKMSDLGNKGPGAMAALKEGFSLSGLFGDPTKILQSVNAVVAPLGLFQKAVQDIFMPGAGTSRQDAIAETAKNAANGFEELRKKGVDLTALLTSSDPVFQKQIDDLNAQGNAGKNTAAYLEMYRLQVQQAQKDAAALGPAGEAAAAAFEKIAHAAGDAQSKTEGLRAMMVALGLLTIDSQEAAAKYADAIDDLSDKMQQAIDAGDGLNNVFKDGKLNVEGSKTARLLVPLFQDLGNSFRQAASSGEPVDDMMSRLNARTKEWADTLGISEPALKNFLTTSVGIVPDFVKIGIQLDGKDKTTQDFANVLLHLQSMAQNGVFVPINMGSPDAAKKFVDNFNSQIGPILQANGSVVQLQAGVQINPTEMKSLLDYLQRNGFNTTGIGGGPPTVPPLPIPAAPAPPTPGQSPPVPAAPSGITAPTAIPGLDNSPVAPQDANAQVQGVTTALTSASSALQGFQTDATKQLDGMQQNFRDGGWKLIDAFAEGITANNAASVALETMLDNLKKNIHQSPPKKGPLSAHGDAVLYAGQQFVKAYAIGIGQMSPAAAAAAGKMGASALGGVAGLSGPAASAGQTLGGAIGLGGGGSAGSGAYAAGYGSAYGGIAGTGLGQPGQGVQDMGMKIGKNLSQFVQFVGHAIDAFSKMANIGLELTKTVGGLFGIGAPEGANRSFFGKSLGQMFGYVKTKDATGVQGARNYQNRIFNLGVGAAGNANALGQNLLDPMTGLPKVLPGQIGPGSSKQDLQAAIAAQGAAVGASQADIAAAFSIVDQESGWNVLAKGSGKGANGTDAVGLFQQSPYADPGTWGKPEDLIGNPQKAIENYWKVWLQKNPGGTDYWHATPDKALERALAVQSPASTAGGGYDTSTLRKFMPQNLKDLQSLLQGGGRTPMTQGAVPGIGAMGGTLPPPPILHDEGGLHSHEASQTGAALAAMFPGIKDIGGAHPDSMPYHPEGRAIDVMIPDWQSAQGKALGTQIRDFFMANAAALGVEDTIWQDFWQPTEGGQGHPLGRMNQGPDQAHLTHVHVTFKKGAMPNVGPQGSNLKWPTTMGSILPQGSFGFPQVPGAAPPNGNNQAYVLGPDGQLHPTATPLQGGPGSAGLPGQERLSSVVANGNVIVTDNLTHQVVGTFPSKLGAPQDITDTTSGTVLGRILPGKKPDEPAYLAPQELLNPTTGKPWTDQEKKDYQTQHPTQFSFPANAQPSDIAAIPGVFPGGTPMSPYQLQQALPPDAVAAYQGGLQPGLSSRQYSQYLQTLEDQRQDLITQDTPESRYQAAQIGQQQQEIMSQNQMQEAPNPIDTFSGILGQASGVAGDIVNTINAGLDAVNATKDIADTITRGVANTKDVSKTIDDFQKYITVAADIAQTTGDIFSTIGSITGAIGSASPMGDGGASAALETVGQIADLISAGLQLTNAFIDLGQEAMKTVGGVLAPKLQQLVGGAAGGLTGDVKFLLDTRTNQVLAYSQDNPADKRAHDMFNQSRRPTDTDLRNQMIGQVNVYGGPGTDPRDDTRQMMYQVKVASLTQATALPG